MMFQKISIFIIVINYFAFVKSYELLAQLYNVPIGTSYNVGQLIAQTDPNMPYITVEVFPIGELQDVNYGVQCHSIVGETFQDGYNSFLQNQRSSIALPIECSKSDSLQLKQFSDSVTSPQGYVNVFIFGAGTQDRYCPFNCGSNGVCNNLTGTCICNESYSGYDCSISKLQIINVEQGAQISQAYGMSDNNNRLLFFQIQPLNNGNIDQCFVTIYSPVSTTIRFINKNDQRLFTNQVILFQSQLSFQASYYDLYNNVFTVKTNSNTQIEFYLSCPEQQDPFKIPFIACCTVLGILVLAYLIYLVFNYYKLQKIKQKKASETQPVYQPISSIQSFQPLNTEVTIELKKLISLNPTFQNVACHICLKRIQENETVFISKYLQIRHNENCQRKDKSNSLSNYSDTVIQFEKQILHSECDEQLSHEFKSHPHEVDLKMNEINLNNRNSLSIQEETNLNSKDPERNRE